MAEAEVVQGGEEDLVEDMDHIEEQEGELNTDKVKEDIATFARNVDTIHYCIAQSSQNMFPEATM